MAFDGRTAPAQALLTLCFLYPTCISLALPSFTSCYFFFAHINTQHFNSLFYFLFLFFFSSSSLNLVSPLPSPPSLSFLHWYFGLVWIHLIQHLISWRSSPSISIDQSSHNPQKTTQRRRWRWLLLSRVSPSWPWPPLPPRLPSSPTTGTSPTSTLILTVSSSAVFLVSTASSRKYLFIYSYGHACPCLATWLCVFVLYEKNTTTNSNVFPCLFAVSPPSMSP